MKASQMKEGTIFRARLLGNKQVRLYEYVGREQIGGPTLTVDVYRATWRRSIDGRFVHGPRSVSTNIDRTFPDGVEVVALPDVTS